MLNIFVSIGIYIKILIKFNVIIYLYQKVFNMNEAQENEVKLNEVKRLIGSKIGNVKRMRKIPKSDEMT